MRRVLLGLCLNVALIAASAAAQPTASGTINGTLTLTPVPFSGAVELPTIDVYSSAGNMVKRVAVVNGPGATRGDNFPGSAPAGGTFTWSATDLQEGRYYVRTTNPAAPYPNNGHVGGTSSGWWVDEVYGNIVCVAADCDPTRGTPIDVVASPAGGSSTPASVDVALDYGAVLSGSLPPTTFIGGTTITIFDSRGIELPSRATLNAITLGQTYFANGLPAGTYFLKMGRDNQGKFPAVLYKDSACNGCAVTAGTPVVVTLGEARDGINFIELADRAIRGTVRSGGTALQDVTVQVYSPNGELAAASITAADGTYSVPGLNAGTYYAVTLNSSGFVDAIYPAIQCPGCDPLSGTAIVVQSTGDTAGIDFDLTQGGTLDSTTKISVPSPGSDVLVPGVTLSIYTPSNTLAARGTTDSNGRLLRTVPAGTYRIQMELTNGQPSRRNLTPYCPQGICAPGTGDPYVVSAGATTTVAFLLTPVSCGMTLAPVRLASAAVGISYRQALAVTGGTAPYRYAIASGTLPPGVTLDSATGVVNGTPTAAGHYSATLAAIDSSFGCTVTRTYLFDVPGCITSATSPVVSRATGEPFLIPVTSSCSSWSASSNTSWIAVEPVPSTNPTHVLITTSPHSASSPRTGSVTVGSTVIQVYQSGVAPQPPFGVLETPAHGATVSGSIAVSGWALDDLAVRRVQIYRDPVGAESGLVYIGDATLVEGARPDVAAAFPTYPLNTRAGYGYLLLTNVLPNSGNGSFTLHAFAEDIDANRVLIGSRAITVNNTAMTAPFGAIDTPTQGDVIAGQNYVNFGWALTAQPKMIQLDGGTIRVVIDGVGIGPVDSYNLFRSDVSGLFPGLKNSGGPVGYRVLDTTTLSEGIHTIAWVVTDDGGESSGIGSRYFTVRNSAWNSALKRAASATPPAHHAAEGTTQAELSIPSRVDGIETGRRTRSLDSLPLANDGSRAIDLRPMRRLALSLATAADESCAPRYEGYADTGELGPLPVGSSLDPTGKFYWQPGPAFRGTYRLLFVRTTCDGTRERLPVTVHIR